MRVFEGNTVASGGRFGIVVASFNRMVTDRLLDGCLRGLEDSGLHSDLIDLVRVPGSFEIPTAALHLASKPEYLAVVCLGCVIRGETDHYEHVAAAAAHGIAECSMRTGKPVIFGVLTTNTVEQAMQRCGPGKSNSGYEAAHTALLMANLLSEIDRAESAD